LAYTVFFGTIEILERHSDRVYSSASIDWMGKFNIADNTFTYIVGVLVKPNAIAPEGIDCSNSLF